MIKTADQFNPIAPEPGVYSGVPIDIYHKSAGFSKTSLARILKKPALHIWAQKTPRSYSEADVTGNAVHCKVLEPLEFADRYTIAPEVNRRTKAGQEEYAEFQSDAEKRGLIVLKPDELTKINEMSDSIFAHPEANSLLTAPGLSELTFVWLDSDTGLTCKCRADRFVTGINMAVDLKTTEKIDKFQWSVLDLDYDMQAAFYSDGIAAATGAPCPDFPFVVVSKSREMGSYPVRVFSLHENMLDVGRDRYRESLSIAKHCIDSGRWPGVETINITRKY